MNINPTIANYGSWKSVISASLLTAQTVRISEPHLDGENIYWLESRPNEKGRNALVCLSTDGKSRDLLAQPHSLRTRANEYGGGSYTVANGVVYFVLDADQRVYQLNVESLLLTAITEEGSYRYADFCVDQQHQRLLCIREDHTHQDTEERSEIIAIKLDESRQIDILVTGADFYSNPRLNPDGTRLSWLSWNHPQMPWDGTECYIAQLNAHGVIASIERIAGGKSESIFQPQWSPDGDLFFVSDRSNWWNLYRWNRTNARIEAMCEMSAEYATPQWVFGMSTYGFLDKENLLGCYSQNGLWRLTRINLHTKQRDDLTCELTDISAIACDNGRGLLVGANPAHSPALYCYEHTSNMLTTLASSSRNYLAERDLSSPQAISFTTSDHETAHGFYYAPCNPDYIAPMSTLPPLLVMCHGGPTAATESSLNIKIQYWTSRGFAVLDVNYRGSTGYGRQYRDRLKNNWGITDVIDVCSGVDYLVRQGKADPQKIAIRGSSAGGYTVLAALTFTELFSAGASLYGIGNLETLAQDTHKFESHYLDALVGKFPEAQDTYHARSPLFHIDKLNCPVIFLQGLQDKVVPPNQAEAMVNALTKKGITNAYVTFADEGHGFRQAESIERAIEAELYFYSKIFDFELADAVAPIEITHLY